MEWDGPSLRFQSLRYYFFMSKQENVNFIRPGAALWILSIMVFAGCAGPPVVPVSDLTAARSTDAVRVVRAGDSLYTISWEAGFDYRDVALWNALQPPYQLTVGQEIVLGPGGRNIQSGAVTQPVTPATSELVVSEEPVASTGSTGDKIETSGQAGGPVTAPSGEFWIWPARGKLLSRFSPEAGSNGIDIAGSDGSPIRAAANGKVVYAGTGLRGYGRLIIIKHDETFLTAYAHNRAVKINEGDAVKGGQIIAEMGQSGADSVRLHFEIRRDGQPVDPLQYLPDS